MEGLDAETKVEGKGGGVRSWGLRDSSGWRVGGEKKHDIDMLGWKKYNIGLST